MTFARGWRAGLIPIAVIAVVALVGPAIAPHRSGDQFADRAYAPPMRVHLRDAAGWHAPFVYAQHLEDRIARTYSEDRSRRVPLRWFDQGRVVSIDEHGGPLLLLGADELGRDVFSRLLRGAELSLGVAAGGTIGALLIGVFVGGIAGTRGGRLDRWLMLVADFILVLPGAYVILVLRGLLPLVLGAPEVFVLMMALFAASAWPHVARGVRAIVATERTREYAEAARASGAGTFGLLRHLVPAARGFVLVEIVLLVPALLVAEATVSYFGIGFPEPTASWGTMLQEAGNVTMMADAPWLLASAVAIFVVVFALHIAGGTRTEHALFTSSRS
jgi:peptide/nickel transport system permease protein